MATAVQTSRAGDLYFQLSRDDVARVAPAFVIPSCLLPPGYVVADHLPSSNIPLLLYREPITGTVRAYRNQCRHRGAALVSPTCTIPRRIKGSAIVCPYHSWTYDGRNGGLKKITGDSVGFPCLEKESLGLTPLLCREVAGGIWIGGESFPKDVSAYDETDRELQAFWLDPPKDDDTPTRFVGYREWTIQANWQLLVETFLESYHVQFLHQDTLGLVTHSNRMVVDRLDTYSLRHTVPLSNFESKLSLLPPPPLSSDYVSPKDPFFSQTTTTYFLFPNVAISLFKRFALFLSILPNSSHGSSVSSRVRLWGVTHTTAEGEDLSIQKRDLESVIKGIEEDWVCAEGIQKGLTRDTIFHHGLFEGNNIQFLRHVGELAARLDHKKCINT